MFAVFLTSNNTANHLLFLFRLNAFATQKQGSAKRPDTRKFRVQISIKDQPNKVEMFLVIELYWSSHFQTMVGYWSLQRKLEAESYKY